MIVRRIYLAAVITQNHAYICQIHFYLIVFTQRNASQVSVATVVWEYPIKCSTIKPEVGQYGNSGVGVECWGFDNCGDTNEVRNQSIAIQWGIEPT